MAARSPNLSRSLTDALKAAQTQPADAATIALARRYAALIEDAEATAAALDTIEPEDEGQAELPPQFHRHDPHSSGTTLGSHGRADQR